MVSQEAARNTLYSLATVGYPGAHGYIRLPSLPCSSKRLCCPARALFLQAFDMQAVIQRAGLTERECNEQQKGNVAVLQTELCADAGPV